MARFCPKCGAMQDEGSRFCGSCGTPIPAMEAQAPVNHQPEPQMSYAQPQQNYAQPQQNYAQPQQSYAQPQQNYYSQPEPPKKKSNKKVIGIIIAAVALIAAIVIALFATGVIGGSDKEADEVSNTPEGVVKALISAYKNLDAEAIVECMPPFMFEDEDLDEMIEDLQDSFDEMKEYGVKINISIDGEVKDLTDDDLEELEDQLYEYDIDIDDISDYKKIKIKMTMSYEGEEMGSQSSDLILIKYNGKWYIGGGLDF